MILFLYSVLLLITSIYSYTLVDPNITLINADAWAVFREGMIYWGYYRREVTSVIYIALIILLFVFHFIFLKYEKRFHPLKIAGIVGILLLISYPFLSHDFFNYLFDAKILTYYHQNPYTHKALDFPGDPWLRFMHWTHRAYPYGPVYLALSLLPSFLSFGKFILAYGFLKLLFVGSYIASVWYLAKLNKRWALLFATHPLVIMEGLLNMHNDFIAVALAIAGIYHLHTKREWWARVLFILSGGIKYITVPVIALTRYNQALNALACALIVGILGYLSLRMEVQPWYFLALLIFIPYYEQWINRLWILFTGLLIAYYPFIRYGGWDTEWKVWIKHTIIVVFLVLNIFYLFIVSRKRS